MRTLSGLIVAIPAVLPKGRKSGSDGLLFRPRILRITLARKILLFGACRSGACFVVWRRGLQFRQNAESLRFRKVADYAFARSPVTWSADNW